MICGIIVCGGSTLRTFLCVPLQADIKDHIASTAHELQERMDTRASWVQPQNYHVTIRFLGEIDPLLTVNLRDACHNVTSQIPSFEISIDKLGAFPSLDRPRVIWVGGKAPEPFRALLSLLDSQLFELGFPHTRQETLAHITLARIKGHVHTPLDQIAQRIKNPKWMVKAGSLVLMESELTKNGPIYSPLFTLPLVNGEPKPGGKKEDAI